MDRQILERQTEIIKQVEKHEQQINKLYDEYKKLDNDIIKMEG